MKAIIVCKGFPPSEELLSSEYRNADLVIGADGGGNILLDQGFVPDVVIGDLDSFEKPASPDFEIIRDRDQETNDLEKALKLALAREADECVVLGTFGRRMDHSLKNLSVLKQFDARFKSLVFKDDYQECLLVTSKFEAEVPAGTTVSLFPLSGRVDGITLDGLKYTLNDEALINGQRDGTSNETTGTSFSIEVKEGDLVVFIGR